MNEYQRMIAYLKIMYHNMVTLHRNLVRDEAWFSSHKQLGKWYGEISDQIDDLAETGIALGYAEPGIKDCVLAFTAECLPVEQRRPDETFRLALGYMRGIAGMMQAAESIVPANVANKLQEYEYFWNKEANFKAAAMLGDHAHSGQMEIDDDD